jgi:hypothetical protein
MAMANAATTMTTTSSTSRRAPWLFLVSARIRRDSPDGTGRALSDFASRYRCSFHFLPVLPGGFSAPRARCHQNPLPKEKDGRSPFSTGRLLRGHRSEAPAAPPLPHTHEVACNAGIQPYPAIPR